MMHTEHHTIKNRNWWEAAAVCSLQTWPRIWTRNNREQLRQVQVTRAGIEPGTARLWLQQTDHSATLPPPSFYYREQNMGTLLVVPMKSWTKNYKKQGTP